MTEPATSVRVFLVDDHALFRSGVRAELDRSVPDVTVVGEAGSVAEAVVGIRAPAPGRGAARRPHARRRRRRGAAQGPARAAGRRVPGAERLRRRRGRHRRHPRGRPRVRHQDDLRSGAGRRGRRVPVGDAVFSPRLAGFVLDAFSDRPGAAPPTDPELDLLTRREREVLRLLARGYAYKEIAARAVHLDQDGRDARVERAAQDAAVEPVRAVPLGVGPPAGLREPPGHDLPSSTASPTEQGACPSVTVLATGLREGAGSGVLSACSSSDFSGATIRSGAVRGSADGSGSSSGATMRSGSVGGSACAAVCGPVVSGTVVSGTLVSGTVVSGTVVSGTVSGTVVSGSVVSGAATPCEDRSRLGRLESTAGGSGEPVACRGTTFVSTPAALTAAGRGSWSPGASRSASAGSEGPPPGSRRAPRPGGRSPKDRQTEPGVRARWHPAPPRW